MATRKELVSQMRQAGSDFIRAYHLMQRIVEVWQTSGFTAGLTDADTGDPDILAADLVNLVTALAAIDTAMDANTKTVRKAFYKMIRKVDP